MKNVNVIKFVSDASVQLSKYAALISQAENYDQMKQYGNRMIGFIDCMITFSNGMICLENNEITAMLDDVENAWLHDTYQAMINRADEIGVDHDTLWRLMEKRDEYIR